MNRTIELFKGTQHEPDCSYTRIYLNKGEDLKLRVTAVAADSSESDILPASAHDGDGIVVEAGMRCPTICPPASPLNF